MIEIEWYDIVLINMVTYMGGIFTGLGLCIKYKHKLFRSKSQENLSRLLNRNFQHICPGLADVYSIAFCIADERYKAIQPIRKRYEKRYKSDNPHRFHNPLFAIFS